MSDASAPAAAAAISIRQTVASSKWSNATCPKCQKQLAEGDQVVLCPKCYAPQHAQCWRDNGNQCATDQTPARLIERPVRGGGAGGATATPAAAGAGVAVVPPKAASAAAAPAPAATAAPVAAGVSAAMASGPAISPWRDARLISAPPEADLWRRNIMTIVVITFIWGIIVLVAWLLGLTPAPA